MRKTLLGTSALVAVGLIVGSASVASAAEPIKLSVGGEIVQWFGGGSNDDQTLAGVDQTSYASTGFFTDNVVKFTGMTTLDNGIKVSAMFGRDADGTGRMDSYVKFTSDKLGDLRFGILRPPQDTLAHSAPGVGIGNGGGDYGQFVNDPCGNCVDRTSGSGKTAHGRYNSLVYYTPRIGGAGFGVAFGEAPGNPSTGDVDLADNKAASTGNMVSAAFVYEADIAGVGVGFDIGYTNNDGGVTQTSSGLNLSMNGFTVGGSWGTQDDPRGGLAINNAAWTPTSTMWDIGASYETGPYTVSLNYSNTVADHSQANKVGNDERNVVIGSVSYAVGAGLDLKGSVFSIDVSDAAGVANNENTAVGAAVGVVLGF